jgi:hypothetical protein
MRPWFTLARLGEAQRLLNIDHVPDAVVSVRQALEELGGPIPPAKPENCQAKPAYDYRTDDAATRIRRMAWSCRNLCHVEAHVGFGAKLKTR